MRVLVGCEFSGIVRDAFLRFGHDAWSCDLEPSEVAGPHLQCDLQEALTLQWDLGIFHPPCTFLAQSGARWLYKGVQKSEGLDDTRWKHMYAACEFFRLCLLAKIPKVCVENPQQHGHAQKIIGVKWSQKIQPWQFGCNEQKSTYLWLRNLTLLVPTVPAAFKFEGVHNMPPSLTRTKDRSRTFHVIADAMACQWGKE